MKPNLVRLACLILFTVCRAADTLPAWSELQAERVVPYGDNKAAIQAEPGRFTLAADFATLKAERASWDFPIRLDLLRAEGISFDFFCSNTESCSGFCLYLKSESGWYTASLAPRLDSVWQRVTLPKDRFARTEGRVNGWSKITTLRLSAWRGTTNGKLEMGVANLSVLPEREPPQIGVVRADSCAADARYKSEKENFSTFSVRTLRALRDAGLPVREISDRELDAAAVKGLKLLVFPYNPHMPKEASQIPASFVARGGKLFACHSTPPEVRKALGLDERRYQKRNWRGSSETPSAEKHGFYLPHVWRYPPAASTQQAYDLLSRVEPAWKPRLDAARAAAARKAAEEAAWVASRPSKAGEWRAFWCHSAYGPKDMNWETAIHTLKENGFNAILPNFAWGGSAFYESSVLPVNAEVATKGDALAECLAACRKHGVECHAWKVCWRLGRATGKKARERFRAEGRLQKNFNGKEIDWLCPSRPENLTLEIEAFLELARKGVDGVHFDYIRYSDRNCCFCDVCRRSFEKQLGTSVANWPKDVRKDPHLAAEWRKFRCGNITALVRGVATRMRKEHPNVKLSAAVFQNFVSNPENIGQDWVLWCKEGLLDFACPMDYYGGANLVFQNLVATQKRALEGCPVKLRPGLGTSCWPDPRRDVITMAKQIEIVRGAGLDGFTIFQYDARTKSALPTLHAGPLR